MSDDLIEKVARAMWKNALAELDEETAIVMSGDGWEQFIPDARVAGAIAAAELAAERERAGKYQRIAAELSDRLNGTPCAEIRWQQERDELRAELAAANALLHGTTGEVSIKGALEELAEFRLAWTKAAAELAAERVRVEKLSQENAVLRCEAAGGRERVAKLREALEPFAQLLVGRLMTDGLKYSWRIDVAHVRRARAALAETKENGDD